MYLVNDDLSIYATRGDTVLLNVQAMKGGEPFTFPAGSVIRMKVFEKKNCENVVLQKVVTVEEDTDIVAVDLTKSDTKIGGVISKPVDYWYEVELDPFTNPQTISDTMRRGRRYSDFSRKVKIWMILKTEG